MSRLTERTCARAAGRLRLTGRTRLQQRLATHFVPFSEFEKDAAAGTLPDFSLIERDMASGHNDYHPALSRSMIGNNADFGFDPPSSLLGGRRS